MAQVRALVRKLVLKELLASEVLEVRVIDPAFAHAFVGQAGNMLEQKKPNHKPCRNSRPTTIAVQRRDLPVDELPVDLACELHQLVPHVECAHRWSPCGVVQDRAVVGQASPIEDSPWHECSNRSLD